MSDRDELAQEIGLALANAYDDDSAVTVEEPVADVLWSAGWRKKPSRKVLLDALYEPNQYATNERVFAGRALAQSQAEAIADAILALLDGPTND